MSWLSSAIGGVTNAVHDVRTALNLPPITLGNVAKVAGTAALAGVTGGTSLGVTAAVGAAASAGKTSILDKLKSGVAASWNTGVAKTVATINDAQQAAAVTETVKSNGPLLIGAAVLLAFYFMRKR